MAKKLAEILAFKPIESQIVPFPITKLCGCGCGELINKQEDAYITSEETGQWYVDEVDFLKAVQAVERNGFYHFRDDNNNYWYTKTDFYEELQAYWMNDLVPIA